MSRIVVIGSLNMDFVVNLPRTPKAGETLSADTLDLIPGGKGANQACAAGKLGADVAMIGAVGADTYGDRLLDSLSSAGVDVSRIARLPNEPTGMAFITVNAEGDNCIIVVSGANRCVTPAMIDQHCEAIEQCDTVVMQLEIPMETVIYAAKLAKSLGKRVILDPAPAPAHMPEELLRHVDLMKPNQSELRQLIQRDDLPLTEAAKFLKETYGVGSVIVTLGGDGAFVDDFDGKQQTFSVPEVPIVDTTAAGDAFTATVAMCLSRGETLFDAVTYANRVSTVVVTRAGAQSSLPTAEEVDAFFAAL